MLSENQYVLSAFMDNFSRCKDKRIVLYGKGPFTKLILDLVKGYNIIGIMDRDLKSGFIYGFPVLSYRDIVQQKIDIIIVISRPNSIKAVFDRIHNFCTINHIQLYGISGENLYQKFNQECQCDSDIIHVFEKNYYHIKNKKIALYGKGPRTQIIVEGLPDYNIVGIMDRDIKEGVIYGKRVLSYDAVLEEKIDIIILVTREWSTPFVYNRIGKFCLYNHITLFDVEGNNLFMSMGEVKDEIQLDSYFDVSEMDLKSKIQEYDIISFDIFDTLIMRKTLLPTDVFVIVGHKAKKMGIYVPNFSEVRKKAEQEVLHQNPSIYDIYARLHEITGIERTELERILDLEIETEREVLLRRDKMVEILQYAISLGKRVCLISDMYLPKDILISILTGLDITGYEQIFVSCDYNASKCSGLFDIFKRQIRGKTYLHIGDNRVADLLCAEPFGIDGFYIKKSLDMLDISGYASIRSYLTNINERSMVGLFIAKVFNNPFALYHSEGRAKVNNIYDFGYLFVSEAITDFVIWLVENLRKRQYDRVLFAARDGYIIQKMYDQYLNKKKIKDAPESYYFYISRMVVSNASIETEKDIQWFATQPYAFGPEERLINKFGFTVEEILSYNDTFPDEVHYELAQKELIYKRSKEVRENYYKYVKRLGIDKNQKCAFVDLVSSGTCQYFMERIKLLNFDAFYLCYYNIGDKERDAMYHSERWNEILNKNNSYMSYLQSSNIYQEYWLLETILTSEEASIRDFDEFGNPIFAQEHRSESEMSFVQEIHRAILDYFEDYSMLYIENISISGIVADTLYGFKNLKYTNECCEIFDDFTLFEDMGMGRLKINRH